MRYYLYTEGNRLVSFETEEELEDAIIRELKCGRKDHEIRAFCGYRMKVASKVAVELEKLEEEL
jgi:hypothetical protein